MAIHVPNDAQCLSCGYRLRELSEPVCPECARAFDPEDPTTFITDPRRRRRRRVRIAVCSLIGTVLVALALWPRGIGTAHITFTDKVSGNAMTVRRWEPLPPRWIPFRYPGWHWTTTSEELSIDVSDPASFTVATRTVFAQGGSMGMTGGGQGEMYMTINAIPATPRHAPQLLKQLLSPSNRGVRSNLVMPADLPDPP